MKIPLFDIDYTLIKRHPNNKINMFAHVLKKTYEIENPVIKINYTGMLDPQIILEMAILNGISPKVAKKKLTLAMIHLHEHFIANYNEINFIELKGGREILTHLKNNGIPLGLLTGNIEPVAWKKLEKVNLHHFFNFGAFGNMAMKRSDLVPIALESLRKKHGNHYVMEHLVIIGDSLKDIECAKETKIKVIAVATGKHSKKELQEAGADLAIDSLKEKTQILKLLS